MTNSFACQRADNRIARERYAWGMKVILTGATGMVGEGVLLECLENPAVERVLSVSRRPSGLTHPTLTECLLPDFRELAGVEPQLTGYDACFYCAGVSSVGMKEPEYTHISATERAELIRNSPANREE